MQITTRTATRTEGLSTDQISGYMVMLSQATTFELLDHLEVAVAHRNSFAHSHPEFARAHGYVELVRLEIMRRTEV